MSIALAENGFVVKPMPTQQQITELQNPNRIAKYNEATTRWGISLQTQYSPMKCAFTDFDIHHFTLMLTDIETNQVVLVLKQKGSDGPCTTVEPVLEPWQRRLRIIGRIFSTARSRLKCNTTIDS